MNREKIKLAAIFLGVAAFIVIFWAVVRQIETKEIPFDDADMETEGLFDNPEDTFHVKTQGTLKIGGKKYHYQDEIKSYLFIGTDASGSSGEGEEYQGAMADFLLLLIINKTKDTYSFLQLNRDTMTEVRLLQKDGTGQATAELQLCTAQWYGGNEEQSAVNTRKAVSKLLGKLKIDGYYVLNMEQIPKLNHAVGGVQVTIQDDFSKVDSSLEMGKTVTLSDDEAYIYVHNRYDVGDEKNISRMKRQKEYMKSFLKKVQQQSQDDPSFILKMFQEFEDDAVTDITGKEMGKIANWIYKGESEGFYQLEGTEEEGQALGDGILHVEYYVEKESILQIMTKLYGLVEADKREGTKNDGTAD